MQTISLKDKIIGGFFAVIQLLIWAVQDFKGRLQCKNRIKF